MRRTKLQNWLLAGCLLGVSSGLSGQISPDCTTAIPICSNTPVNGGTQGYGADDFGGTSATGCLEPTLTGFIESNSAWYRFRTGASGQLGFNISFDPSEDWDFALYQASDCGSLGDPVRCNFFDNRDAEVYMGVGEDPTGNPDTYLYEPWLQVEPGQDYYLLINNFSNTNSGFSIQFSGQIFVTNPYDALDCSIISNLLGPPVAACQGDTVPLDATTASATGYQWFSDTGSGFVPIAGETGPTFTATNAAVYRVQVDLPDGSQVISDVQVGFSPAAMAYPMSDQGLCSDDGTLDLTALDDQALGAQDPADFRVSYHSSAADAQLGANPITSPYSPAPGSETIYVRVSSLENPNCYDASESFLLEVLATPTLDFEPLVFICADGGSVAIGAAQSESGVTYQWDSGQTNPSITVNQPGTYVLTATAMSLGQICTAQRSVEVQISTPPNISNVLIEDLQASNTVTVETDAVGDFEYALNDGAFQSSPVFQDVPAGAHQVHMRDTLGCGQVTEDITVVGFLPFFTPNGDGLNDQWQVVGMEMLQEPVIHIFDRYGKLLKQMDSSSSGWDGTFNGRLLPASDYWFRLSYLNAQGERVEARYLNAHFSLKR